MELWMFWVAAALLVLAVVVTLARAMWQAQAETRASASFDLAVYRDQLSEIERDIARGTIPADEGARLRTEIQRRLLEADRKMQADAPVTQARAGWGATGIVCLMMAAGAAGYWQLGAPGYPDLPLAQRFAMSDDVYTNRPTQAEVEASAAAPTPRTDVDPEFADLVARLRQAVTDRPDDLQGFELLARNEAALGNLGAARDAQARVVALKGAEATGEDYAGLAELMIIVAGGFVSPEAETELVRALERDPANATARYYSGLMFAQIGRFDRTFALWRRLLDESPPDAPWVMPIRAQMEDVAARAGVRYELPPAPQRGPDGEAIAAAAEMTEAERAEMITGMVDQLAERLASNGGPAEDWAQLIRSLAQIGRTDQAREVWAEAQVVFAGRTVEMSALREIAVLAGVAE
jgi:cytochrome c-type biogenesis protein CcmH